MATVLSPTEQKVIIENVSWQTYEQLLADLADRSAPRLTYDRGRLQIMSPTSSYEELNRNLALVVTILAAALGLDVRNLGSTTFRREDLSRGFEPDSCFYVEHEPSVRGKARIDLSQDPPPDLVIEIDITSGSLDKFPIYLQVGVPEIWHYDGRRLIIHQLTGGLYQESETSRAFPNVRAAELDGLLRESLTRPSTQWLRALQEWADRQTTTGPL
jgi:Uma2 family endonuclease